jgi:hypothetical protein
MWYDRGLGEAGGYVPPQQFLRANSGKDLWMLLYILSFYTFLRAHQAKSALVSSPGIVWTGNAFSIVICLRF